MGHLVLIVVDLYQILNPVGHGEEVQIAYQILFTVLRSQTQNAACRLDDEDDTELSPPVQASSPRQRKTFGALRMICRATGPTHGGSSVELGFIPGSPPAPRPRHCH
ncbi:hypothetical protein AVEN_27239-1 [Araneus ventricosus]|uniref:Uncharacterized protein n=1 Tax=Araneus ventricosus TaxID=182803 RepID=A0A4Y2C9Z6_ARAVE|nr:hypothetical protein AVEN_27239-1 [Araneus ventricosus]